MKDKVLRGPSFPTDHIHDSMCYEIVTDTLLHYLLFLLCCYCFLSFIFKGVGCGYGKLVGFFNGYGSIQFLIF